MPFLTVTDDSGLSRGVTAYTPGYRYPTLLKFGRSLASAGMPTPSQAVPVNFDGEDLTGWVGTVVCDGDSVSGNCVIRSTAPGDRISGPVPGYVPGSGLPYKASYWLKGVATGHPAVSEWTPFEFVVRDPVNISLPFFKVDPRPGEHVRLDRVTIRQVTYQEHAEWSDNVIRSLGRDISVPMAPNRLAYLPRTMSILLSNRDLRVIMLGDSLMNNTFYGAWDALIKRRFAKRHNSAPGIRQSASFRGSTGVDWFSQDNHLYDYVYLVDPDVDLVMIGGISSVWQAEPWVSTIQQIRVLVPQAEIVIVSSATGLNPESSALLAGVAAQEQVAFIDSSTAYLDYLQDAGYKRETFLIDGAVHQNAMGQELLGRVIAKFFTEPTNS